jgi:hypothetical protein
VRRFQSAAEREAEGRTKGYAGVLEADLWRAEARRAEALRRARATGEGGKAVAGDGTEGGYGDGGEGAGEADGGGDGDGDEEPVDREHGLRLWRDRMTTRFLRGGDADFEYPAVDEGVAEPEEREAEESWFDREEASWEGTVLGETGVQDF